MRLFFYGSREWEGVRGCALTQESKWPNTQYFASCLYCASFQKEAKVCVGYKKRTKIREHNGEVIE